jgi:hypothetical protein
MAKWEKKRLRLRPDHQWEGKPGYKIFVADRGAVRFNFPEDWIVVPGEDSIKFHDKTPPDDNCTLQVSVMRLPPMDWSKLPLNRLVKELIARDSRSVTSRGEVVDVLRHDLDIAWAEVRFIDPNENREACSRTCLARGSFIQPLITLDYWASDADWVIPAWDEVLSSLKLGEFVNDPRRGDLR